MIIPTKLKAAWNAFMYDERVYLNQMGSASMSSRPPDRSARYSYNDRTLLTSILTKIAIDVADIPIRHILLDENDRFLQDISSGLNICLKLEANIDQGPREFIQNVVATMLEHGVAAIVPVETTVNPFLNKKFDIKTLRVGEVKAWKPQHVQVSLYNESTGLREDIWLPKKFVAIVVNPFYSVMNEPNSTLRRLLGKMATLDALDDQASSGKLDIIIQLPYVIKSDAKQQHANKRKADIEEQLTNSKYGIAYTDSTEKITQLNRPAENNLLGQVDRLTKLLYSQLGMTQTVMEGTASENEMLQYQNRTLIPILDTIVQAMERSFVGRVGYDKKERIEYFRDPFKLIPVATIAEIADRFTRNEILTANEIRQVVGINPSGDPKADKLINSNMPQPPDQIVQEGPSVEDLDSIMSDVFAQIKGDIDEVIKQVETGDV